MPVELALAILVLLVTPGPTNSLILLAGAAGGLRYAVRLIPVELAAYLLAVVPLALIGQRVTEAYPDLRVVVALVAAAWVAFLAVRLWRQDEASTTAAADAPALFLTTLLNPKGLVFGLVLLPSPDRLGSNLLLFSALVVVVALGWAALGAGLREGTGGQPRAVFVMRRLASVFLTAMSLALVVRGMTA